MKDKTPMADEIQSAEERFLERLRQHPERTARFQSILDLAHAADGPIETADVVEERVIAELRQLGHATLNQWAAQAEQRLAEETKAADATVRSRKKTLTWWCVCGLVSVQDRVWRSQHPSYLRPLPARLGVSSGGRSRRLDRVLMDFGSEHSFVRAAASVRENYGIEINASSVRAATLIHAPRAPDQLQAGYDQPFRVLPAKGSGPPHSPS